MRPSPSLKRRSWRSILALFAMALTLAACSGGQVIPATNHGDDLHTMYLTVFWVGTLIFVAVEIAIFYMVIRYRRRKNDDGSLPEQIHGNNFLEIVWTVVPSLIVIVLFVLSWQQINRVETVAAKPGVTMDIIGFQWQWRFKYADDNVEIVGSKMKLPTMVLPVNTPVKFRLFSDNVIHSFYVPAALYKLDLVPGKNNVFSTTFVKTGNFEGHCAELCGIGHADMLFNVKVVTRAEYDKWIADQKAEALAKKLAQSQCKPEGTTLSIAAKDIAFSKPCLAAPADTAVSIDFDNQDATQHNIAIYKSKEAQAKGEPALFKGAIVTGPKKVQYKVDPLAAGQYYFICDVHPQAMTGTFNSGAPAAAAAAGAPAMSAPAQG